MLSFKSLTRREAPSDSGAVLARVSQQVDVYRVVTEERDGRWVAYVPAMPDRTAEAATAELARQKLQNIVSSRFMQQLAEKRFSMPAGPNDCAAEEGESTEACLRRALDEREFRLQYLPAVDLSTGNVGAMEALIRWIHPQRGLLGAAEFIADAERLGLMPSLDDWVLDETCRQLKSWMARGSQPTMSVNLSPGQLQRPSFTEQILRMLESYELDPGQLRLEFTEAALSEDSEAVMRRLERLRAEGLHLTVDDVNAERSSLMRLRELRIDSLKLDRPLVAGIAESGRDAALVQAITLLAHTWGLTVTAEGVETQDQLDALRSLGCDYAQGFYFGRPAAGDEAFALMSVG